MTGGLVNVLVVMLGAAAPTDALPAFGHSVTVDPGFAYYKDRSPESIASEIHQNGYRIVRYIPRTTGNIDGRLIAAFHDEGIGVWYLAFGNGTYSTEGFPPDWVKWKMVTRSDLLGKPLSDGYQRLCLNHPDFRRWQKRQMGEALKRFPLQGIDIAEPHWPEYPGPESPAYACFCGQCRRVFRQMFPEEKELPDIIDADSPRAPSRNPELWRKWLQFREATLTDFLDDLVNGPGGIRQTAPKAKVCTWTLALAGEDGLKRVLEDSGEDAGEIVARVKPDLHCLQTHWPDWLKAKLPPTYVEGYQPFIEQIRRAAPGVPIMIQADVGSKEVNIRSREWVQDFERACVGLGVENTTFYEYFIGGYIYTEPPRIAEVCSRRGRVELHFTKRLDPAAAGDPASYVLSRGRIRRIEVDGSIVLLTVDGIRRGAGCTLTAKGIQDTADRRLYPKRRIPVVLESQMVEFEY